MLTNAIDESENDDLEAGLVESNRNSEISVELGVFIDHLKQCLSKHMQEFTEVDEDLTTYTKRIIILIQLADLILSDEETTHAEMAKVLARVFILPTLSLFALTVVCFGAGNRNNVSLGEQITANIFGVLFSLCCVALSPMFVIGCKRSLAVSRNLPLARKMIEDNLDKFEQNNRKVLLFKNPEFNNTFAYDLDSKQFSITDSTMLDGSNILFPDGFALLSLRSLYTTPTTENFGGAIAGLKMLVDKSKDFSGNLFYSGGEHLVYIDRGSIAHKMYAHAIETIIAAAIRKASPALQAHNSADREQLILGMLYLEVVNQFSLPIPQTPFTPLYKRLFTRQIPTANAKEMNEVIESRIGVCRHRSLVLAKLISFAIQDGLLEGNVILRENTITPPFGHAWLQYHNPVLFNNYLVIDALNGVFCEKDKILEEPGVGSNIVYAHEQHASKTEGLNADNYHTRLAEKQLHANPRPSV